MVWMKRSSEFWHCVSVPLGFLRPLKVFLHIYITVKYGEAIKKRA